MTDIVPFSQITAIEENDRVVLVHKPTGKAYVNQTELARWAEVDESTLSGLSKALPDKLKAMRGEGSSDSIGFVRFESPKNNEPWKCIEVNDAYDVVDYYAFEARGNEKRTNAKILVRQMGRAGATVFAYKLCGYQITPKLTEQISVNNLVLALPDAWSKRFPDNWFLEAERLTGYPQQSAVMARFVKKVIYSIMPKPVLAKLEEENPPTDAGHRKHKLHQYLQNEALDFLEERIRLTYPLIKASHSTKQFYQLLKSYDTPVLRGGN